MEIEVLGASINVRVDGRIAFGGSIQDDDIATGSIAFYSQTDSGATFDDLMVTVK